jgi:homoserine O-acetyltransferase
MIVTTHTMSFTEPLPLQSGRNLPAYDIAYETYGALNRDRSNAVLVCHGLTADAHAAGKHSEDDNRPGWWDTAIGPGKALDTNRFFIVCSNVIGGCGGSTGPSSIEPGTGRPYGLRFPVVTIRDMVDAQARLADGLGIQRFHTVVGGCMGGFQVMKWMARHPKRLAHAIIIGATPRTTAHNLGLWEVFRQAIMRDPNFNHGDYYDGEGPCSGFGLAQMFGMMVWMSREVMAKRFGLRLIDGKDPSYSIEPEFEFQAFLHKIGANAGTRFDANTLIYLTKAMDYFDMSRGRGSLAEAFEETTAKTLLVSYASDWRYPPAEMNETRVALEANGVEVRHEILESHFGHGAFTYDSERILKVIKSFVDADSS